MRSIAAIGMWIALVLALPGCERHEGAQPPANAPTPSQSATPGTSINLGERDSGRTIEVSPGQAIVVQLPGNPTTGYTWSMITSGDNLLVPSEGIYSPDVSTDQRVGGGGTESWSFTAQQSGEQELRFEYRRPWERDQPPIKSVSYVIRVQ